MYVFKNDILFNICIDYTLLSQLTSTYFLGINLDTCLNWKCHLGYLKNKLLKIVLIIKNISYFVNTSAMIKLYILCFILSIFNLLYRNMGASLCIKLKYNLFYSKNDFKHNFYIITK